MSRLAEGSGRTRPGAQPWLMSAAIFVAMIGSALSINGAIRSWSWLWFAIVTVGGLLLLLAILRSVKAPAWLVPIAGLAALVMLLTAEFFSDSALLGTIPTGDTFTELSTAVDLMINTIVGGVAPVQDNQGMALLVSAGLGLTTLLVDVLAVSLAMPATAGLGMVAVLVIPALVKVDSVGAFAFVLGAAGYLMILGLSQWYRPDGASGPPTGRQPGQLLRGSVITAGTLAVAMAVATVMPGFDTGAFPQGSYFNPFGVSSGINPLITLGEDLRSQIGRA
ncbi:MAG: transglutaminase, partial [Acidobacteria bacterium]|nr:transglutaminase [Acidobacteriota bacterium]